MKITVLIVDDEPLARKRMRQLVETDTRLQLLGESADGFDAIETIERDSPDLILLDIQMPELDGFQVLQRLPKDQLPLVIFATAFDQHAIKAFEAHALDYLLKPINTERFTSAIDRAYKHIEKNQTNEAARNVLALLSGQAQDKSSPRFLTRLTIRDTDRVAIIPVTNIDYIESAGNYVAVHTGTENHILRETLNSLEKQLDPSQFLRISRSAIVKLPQIKELQPMIKGECIAILESGTKLTVTRGIRELEKALRFSA